MFTLGYSSPVFCISMRCLAWSQEFAFFPPSFSFFFQSCRSPWEKTDNLFLLIPLHPVLLLMQSSEGWHSNYAFFKRDGKSPTVQRRAGRPQFCCFGLSRDWSSSFCYLSWTAEIKWARASLLGQAELASSPHLSEERDWTLFSKSFFFQHLSSWLNRDWTMEGLSRF